MRLTLLEHPTEKNQNIIKTKTYTKYYYKIDSTIFLLYLPYYQTHTHTRTQSPELKKKTKKKTGQSLPKQALGLTRGRAGGGRFGLSLTEELSGKIPRWELSSPSAGCHGTMAVFLRGKELFSHRNEAR